MSTEYATDQRAYPFPDRWGRPPDEEHRAGWAASHIRREATGKDNTRRQAALLRRRYGPDGPEAA